MTFDVAADAYARFMGRYSEPLADQLVELAGVRAGMRALDVGCGPGVLTARLVERLGADHVAALDPSPSFVAAARERCPGVDVRQGTAEALPYDDGAFDVALANLVVHFMSDPAGGLREMARVGGVVAATVWNHATATGPLSTFWQAVKDLDPDAADESSLPGTGEGDLGGIARDAGLREISRGDAHGHRALHVVRGVVGALHARRRSGRRLRGPSRRRTRERRYAATARSCSPPGRSRSRRRRGRSSRVAERSRVEHLRRGLLLRLRPGLRPGRRVHAAGRDRRPGDQRAGGARAGARLPRRRRGGGGLPGAHADRLLRRRPLPPGHAPRGCRGRDRRPRGRYGGPAPGPRRRCPAGARHPRPQLRAGDPPRPDPGRRPEVLPADLPRVLRAPVVRARRRPPRRDDPGGRRRRTARAGPGLRGDRRARAAAARRGLRGHVGADPAERRGRPRGCDGAGEPVRQPDHGRPRRGPAAAGPQRERALLRGVRLRGRRPGRVDDRPVLGRPDDGLRVRRAAGGVGAVPRRPAAHRRRRRPRPDPPGAPAPGHLRRQPAHPRRAGPRLPHGPLRAAAADR